MMKNKHSQKFSEPLNRSSNCNAKTRDKRDSINSHSEETIYHRAVQKRGSSSSEGNIVLTDDCLVANINELLLTERARSSEPGDENQQSFEEEDPVPSTSRWVRTSEPRELSIEEKTEQLIKDAEKAKATVFSQTGKNNFEFTARMDEDYLVIGAHIDEAMQTKIVNGEYVDFGKLIPRDRIATEEDERMELVMKNGKAFWVLATGTTTINSFNKWEQAFRIFANIYTMVHPQKASELIQYNHIIHTISMSYLWENVYSYDKEFCMHISKHPNCSWAIILQQAWTMCLKDRLCHEHSP